MYAYLSVDFQRMYESTWHISRNTLSRPFQIDVRFLHFHRISIVKSMYVCRVTDLDEQLPLVFFTLKQRNSRDKLVCEKRKAKQQADFRGMEKVWSIKPRWEKKPRRLVYRGGSGNRREKNAFVTNENASMRYSFASRGVGGGCGSECNIVHPRATAKPITHGRRARTHARAVYTVPRQSVPWIRTSRTLNSHVCVHACMCNEQPPLGFNRVCTGSHAIHLDYRQATPRLSL